MKIYGLVFIIAFVLNIIWEHAHSLLYVSYRGAEITEYILFRAAFFDAAVITLCAYLFLIIPVLKNKLWIMIFALTLFATGLELWALEGGRWMYAESMPIIPFINTGLTPTIQLGLLFYFTLYFTQKFKIWYDA
ncbi:MAG: hypothetical protein Q8R36_02025 [bacterium]|nr:hypothetical protein [bacterium]